MKSSVHPGRVAQCSTSPSHSCHQGFFWAVVAAASAAGPHARVLWKLFCGLR